jgi:hypothetical protein
MEITQNNDAFAAGKGCGQTQRHGARDGRSDQSQRKDTEEERVEYSAGVKTKLRLLACLPASSLACFLACLLAQFE